MRAHERIGDNSFAGTEIAVGGLSSGVFDEYEAKVAAADDIVSQHDEIVTAVNMAACIGGTYAGNIWGRHPSISAQDIRRNLLKSAWKHVYAGLNIAEIASASDRQRFDREMQSPPAFNYENVRNTFADYLNRSRWHVLKGLAEVFSSLDPAYKSHSKVQIGVKALPKRVIIQCGRYNSFGQARLRDVIDALRAFRGRRRMDWPEFGKIVSQETLESEGLKFKWFANGNVHVHFDRPTLVEINKALAEFYGEVIPDFAEDTDKPKKPVASTEVSADLAYYPTPLVIANRLVSDLNFSNSERVLEPSCGCGRILDCLPDSAVSFGIEVHGKRAFEARSKGHAVQIANFLQVIPTGDFDHVVMNPPFAGKHYLKHVEHAFRFLKPGGRLHAILPATAWYDHQMLPVGGRWEDLPVGSFAESGTNVPTGIFRLWNSEPRP